LERGLGGLGGLGGLKFFLVSRKEENGIDTQKPKGIFDKELLIYTPTVKTVGYKNFVKIEIVKCLEQTPLPYSLFLIPY